MKITELTDRDLMRRGLQLDSFRAPVYILKRGRETHLAATFGLGETMKKTLIFYKPEYADLAIKLRDNYRAHDHEEADIVSAEEHDDIGYAEKMQYDEAVFIEDRDTVTFHDIESGYTNKLPLSEMFYNDSKPDSHEAVTNRDALNILADAISDVGSWWCWHAGDDMLQLEFCDVQLYDETKADKETHTTDVLAVRFFGNVFAVFLDDLDDKNWHERFHDDDSILYPVDTYDMAFDDNKEAESLLNEYKNRIPVKDFKGAETLVNAKHILCARCDEVGFIVGGNKIEIAGKKGKYSEEEIEPLSKKWWEYWKEYWRLRGTRDALPKDYACEVTIPVDREDPQGSW
ncbi:MAG: hypothetical protein IJ201_05060 [Solobacterium sp.]|nr:hypothetical protein [Solobacterium sp.]